MVSIAIVDNNREDAASLMELLCGYQRRTKLEMRISCFENGFDIVEQPGSAFYDLVLLDIDIPLMNGLETAQFIRQRDPQVLIVFVTHLSQYAIQGYQVNALDYLLKPVEEGSLALMLERALRCLPVRDDVMIIKTVNGFVRTLYSRIRYAEVNDHRMAYHTDNGIIVTRETMNEVEQKLHAHGFSRPCNSYLVNLAYVQSVRNGRVYLENLDISIGRSRKRDFLNDLAIYLGG